MNKITLNLRVSTEFMPHEAVCDCRNKWLFVSSLDSVRHVKLAMEQGLQVQFYFYVLINVHILQNVVYVVCSNYHILSAQKFITFRLGCTYGV